MGWVWLGALCDGVGFGDEGYFGCGLGGFGWVNAARNLEPEEMRRDGLSDGAECIIGAIDEGGVVGCVVLG